MQVYTLDALYRREFLTDKFKSLIWTERMRLAGDFKLDLPLTQENISRFKIGTRLAMNESTRVMVIKTVEESVSADGENILHVEGPSIEFILKNRATKFSLAPISDTNKWTLTGTPVEVAKQIFHDICVTGIVSTKDIIPSIVEGTLYSEDTILEPIETITYEVEPTTVYDAIAQLCDVYDLGFRITRHSDNSLLYFDVYTGNDRTTSQTTLPAVIFSPDLDNLQNTKALESDANYKNVAYISSPVGHEVVYADGVDPDITEGFDRHVLVIRANDIDDTDPAVATARMIQRAKEALAANRRYQGFDGELTRGSLYKPGIDYITGDMVELRNVTGATNRMQITEQIFVSDHEGERSYPTLSVNTFITPGSWLAWDYNQVWEDLGLTEYWADQP